jgi:RibD C-terminal domain
MDEFDGRKTELPRAPKAFVRGDHIANKKAKRLAIGADVKGVLRFQSNEVDGDHVVLLVTGRVGNDYLAHLQTAGVSYLFCGKKEIELRIALQKLSTAFKLKRLMLQGGGKFNGAMLGAGLVDEISHVTVPIDYATRQWSPGKVLPPRLLGVGQTRCYFTTGRKLATGAGIAPAFAPSKGAVLRLDDPAFTWWPARVTRPVLRIKSPLHHFNACRPELVLAAGVGFPSPANKLPNRDVRFANRSAPALATFSTSCLCIGLRERK